LALFFFVASGAKLIGTQQALEQYAMLGFGEWFRWFNGLVELAGAIGLLIPILSGLAAAGMAIVMALATVADILVLPNPPELTITLCAVFILVVWARWPETTALWRTVRGLRGE
jgi:putative oxidoreductase